MRATKTRNAGLLLGIGLGGFLDGIVLHQIVQWHSMLSGRLPMHSMEAMRTSMTADGWFHMATWLVTLAGVAVLWSAVRGPGPLPAGRALAGWMLVGWGAFNLVEGVVDHHLLELHHVRDLPQHMPAYDWTFLALSLAILVAGWLISQSPAHAAIERRSGYDRRSALPVR
jgi:uncharacterized membrane protein